MTSTSLDPTGSRVACEVFGHLPGGAPVKKVALRGAGGFEIAIITFGAAVQALHVRRGYPDETYRHVRVFQFSTV